MSIPQRYEETGVKQVRSSAEGAYLVSPHNTNELPNGYTKGLYLGVGGDVVAVMRDGTQVTFTNLSSGIVHPISVKQVKSTGTTAGNILALY